MKRDISKYGFKNSLGAFFSTQYPHGHPTAVVHSISTSLIDIGVDTFAGGIYVTWIVIGTWK